MDAETADKITQLKKQIADGGMTTVSDLLGLSDVEVASTYAHACGLLSAGRHGEAAKLFVTLMALRHDEARHYRGLGLCLQQLGQIPFAETCYTIACKLDPHDFASRVFLAEASGGQGRILFAALSLEEALQSPDARKLENKIYSERAKKLLTIYRAIDA